MKLTIDAGDRSLFIQSIRDVRSKEAERTGVHCSTIIHDMNERNAAQDRDDMPESLALAFQEIGNVIEDLVAAQLATRFPDWTKPDPRTHRSGMICSPDGWSPRTKCIDEVKALWKGTKGFLQLRAPDGPEVYDFTDVVDMVKQGMDCTWDVVSTSAKFQGYLDQIFVYMAVWGAQRARLHAFFVNGNYRPPFPEPVTLNLRPSQAEVSMSFNKVIRHGMDMGLLHE